MKIAKTQFPVFLPYNKSAIEIYVSGCAKHCYNCQNPELQDFNIGEEINEAFWAKLKNRRNLFDVISILGGDLLDNSESEAMAFIFKINTMFPQKELWLFTGYNKLEIENYSWVYLLFDYIKVGRYIHSLKQDGFPSSPNQMLLKRGEDY